MRLAVVAFLCLLASPSFGQQCSIVHNGRPYLYTTDAGRQMIEELLRQQQQLEALRSQNYFYRDPTQQEVEAMEKDWKAMGSRGHYTHRPQYIFSSDESHWHCG